jgi:hypothetical protein
VAGLDGSQQPVDDELLSCRNLGSRVAQVAEALRGVRGQREQGQQENAESYTE